MEKLDPTRQRQKQEALRRMKCLGLNEGLIRAFEEDDMIFISDYYTRSLISNDPYEERLWVDKIKEDEQDAIDAFEKEYGWLVYHVISLRSPIPNDLDPMLILLCVTTYEDDWDGGEFTWIEHGEYFYALGYVKNVMVQEMSDIPICLAKGGRGLIVV